MLKYELDFNEGNYIIGHFTIPDCPACDKAKDLLKKYKKQFMFIQADKKLFGKVLKVTGSKMVPQIFMDGDLYTSVDKLEERLQNEDTDGHN